MRVAKETHKFLIGGGVFWKNMILKARPSFRSVLMVEDGLGRV